MLSPKKFVGSLALLLQLIEHLPLPLCVCDRAGEVVGSNSLWRAQPTLHDQLHSAPIALSGAWSQWQLLIGQTGSGVDRLKSDFLACINHELKTPLTSVIGMASLLNQQTVGELNQRQSRYVQMIHQSGRHLMEIINMIVDVAQTESGQLLLEWEPVEIKAVCEASIRQTRRWLEQEAWLKREPVPSIDLVLDIAPHLQFCTADRARLQQMLANLLSNACKFSRPPDAEAVAVRLQVEQWGKWLAFSVLDQGIGIPDAQQPLIFQKFQQADNSLVREYGGTGLGLVLTRQLARLHGGDVSFISQVQGGSKFTILLPSDQGELLPNQLVLVAATDTMEILHFSGWLESLGYRIVIARSGMEALEKIRLLQPLASFLQPNLPVMGGEEVLTVLKHDRPQLANTVKLWTEAMNWDSLVNFFTALAQPPVPQRKPLLLYRSHFLRESIRESLQSLGYSLLECADLAQAEVLARLWRPDLVITSIPWSRYLHSIPTLIVEENLHRELLDRRIQERLNCQHPV